MEIQCARENKVRICITKQSNRTCNYISREGVKRMGPNMYVIKSSNGRKFRNLEKNVSQGNEKDHITVKILKTDDEDQIL